MPKRNKSEAELPAFDLRAEREARGLTQTDAAVLLHTHQTSIARWERDGNAPAIYRMAWKLHWHFEDAKNANKSDKPASKHKKARKSVASVSKDGGVRSTN